jgi:hypothetical protein
VYYLSTYAKVRRLFHRDRLSVSGLRKPALLDTNLAKPSNLIERLWRFVKKQVLYSTHYGNFDAFRTSIDSCIADLGTRFKANRQTLMTMNFQLFSKNPKT